MRKRFITITNSSPLRKLQFARPFPAATPQHFMGLMLLQYSSQGQQPRQVITLQKTLCPGDASAFW